MSRKARKNISSSFAHVMVQGINREYIFNTEKNKEKYKNIIIENLDGSEISILSYSIMSNHTHLITFCENIDELSNFMHKINTTYSRYYNKINDRVGFVFRDRFKIQEITDMNQLYNCLRYVHNNPVKAKMCNSMSEYKYSSYNEFLGKREIINDKSIELLFGSSCNYIENFKVIHESFNDESFIDMAEMNLNEFVMEYISKKKLGVSEIRKNRKLLEEFIKEARNRTDASLNKIATVLDMSKSQVGYYANK